VLAHPFVVGVDPQVLAFRFRRSGEGESSKGGTPYESLDRSLEHPLNGLRPGQPEPIAAIEIKMHCS